MYKEYGSSSIGVCYNPSLNATHDAYEVSLLQQELLWLLYDLGHLKKYPMAIGNLGDLEEISPKEGKVPCKTLFEEAITSARTYYNNQHVYPYTYQGGYFYRNKMYKEAFESWANASDVIRLYNYSRDDEEIYKEFLEIANELIPHIMKVESSGFSASSILKKPECFANLLRFYDGICQWEEGSATPVLHIGWAKPLVNTISKFDSDVRAQVNIICDKLEEEKLSKKNGTYFNNNNYASLNQTNLKEKDLTNFHPSIEALTAACSEKILNPEYLLQGDGSPFVGGETSSECQAETQQTQQPESDNGGDYLIPNNTPPTPPDDSDLPSAGGNQPGTSHRLDSAHPEDEEDPVARFTSRPIVVLRSQKMKQLKDLLLAEKLNTHAISLHLTAQSQVQVGKKGRGAEGEGGGAEGGARAKRARRE
ncbi:unnamed protein product [Callosobruchus maculatus]|uniref:Menin n=1 Tax=Callosobruchus maculatus TaxID=64391 RepID=A0A653DIM7_CALMS|nr:unnamed protein product [Callosobruchus maculatus]